LNKDLVINFPSGRVQVIRARDPNAPKTPLPKQEKKAWPNFAARVGTFCMAIARWKLAGSPVRTSQRVNELLAICQGCEYLVNRDHPTQKCGACGCPINRRTDKPTKNKLVLSTEACPIGKWSAERT
jgi:hypothetical protein